MDITGSTIKSIELQPPPGVQDTGHHFDTMTIVIERPGQRTLYIRAEQGAVVFPYHGSDVYLRVGAHVDTWLTTGETNAAGRAYRGSSRLFKANGANELRFLASTVTTSEDD
jgi:hypothetical protein